MHIPKIYLSASIRGEANKDPDLLWNTLVWLEERAEVLSAHVAARNKDEMVAIFLRRTGVDRDTHPDPPAISREIDFKWVDECDCLIAFVDAPSIGVGMEIQRALDRPDRPPVLCLVHSENFAKLTWMVSGIREYMYPNFMLRTYDSFADVQDAIEHVLAKPRI